MRSSGTETEAAELPSLLERIQASIVLRARKADPSESQGQTCKFKQNRFPKTITKHNHKFIATKNLGFGPTEVFFCQIKSLREIELSMRSHFFFPYKMSKKNYTNKGNFI